VTISLNAELLDELGLGALPAADKDLILGHIYGTLEMRVGATLAERMTDDQLDEFEALIQSNDEDGALAWLSGNFPDYKQVVACVFDELKAEIAEVAQQIVADAMATVEPAR
jgi:hypothetical protein